ncbi:hypothetical protein BIY24_12525 [Halobacteriovorax marinus]|uniref:Uncharacterized protein n=1 Tax=Halobacteriovorax marinus (strain ATCC BAA-682 / DSM 15412 / SJ) TaxID=862908 RepID=E1X694_HALMS|nr:hypothetical protein [Halobacteriovorax marinus]ATH08742.1 hypothetical protein BIY24_12525 [Halobacteriovorax marinus]CBW27439.1 hypothetical protein BMS_2658 [Halobacteriovorax marinus SJ]
MDVVSKEEYGCPHSHKASLILENGELAGEFLSRHFESCEVCNLKLKKLKSDRKLFLKQIPFVTAPVEVKDIFEAESREMTLKVKKRVVSLKRKKMGETSEKAMVFFADLKEALLSKPVVISICLVSTVWSYLKIFN